MREAVGSYFLTTIFIIFVVLFTGYMCLSINMNKAYKVKNEIINIIQKNNGLDDNTLSQIQDYMTKVGYRTTGNCGSSGNNVRGYDYAFGVSGTSTSSNKPVFCVSQIETSYESDTYPTGQFPTAVYYHIKVFYAIDLPIVRQLFTFGLTGSTKKLFYPVTM